MIPKTDDKKLVIIDECDDVMFQNPRHFHEQMKNLNGLDFFICLTGTPGTEVSCFEERFINVVCKFKEFKFTEINTPPHEDVFYPFPKENLNAKVKKLAMSGPVLIYADQA